MNKKGAKNHPSKLIDGLLSEITPLEQERTNKRMQLAAKIDEALKKRGWSQKLLSEKLSKQPSEISKWLSGTHNFTTDTLFDLEQVLDIVLVDVKENPIVQVVNVLEITISESNPSYLFVKGLGSRQGLYDCCTYLESSVNEDSEKKSVAELMLSASGDRFSTTKTPKNFVHE